MYMLKREDMITAITPSVEKVIYDALDVETLHPNFLGMWHREKSKSLFDLFGDRLIIEKEVEVMESEENLKSKIRRWRSEILVELSPVRPANVRNLCSIDELMEGKLAEDKWLTSDIVVKSGSKVSKLIKHLVKKEDFDKVMTSYSQAVNQKKIRGILCLSIHPLDYLTMSYNQSDWESCLNLYHGEYRGGIGAYMNSDVTVVAYLKSSKGDIFIGDTDVQVGDKKWRSMVTITPDWVHVNRHYPYVSSDLEKEVFKMVEELKGQAYVTDTLQANQHSCTFDTGCAYNDTDYHDTKIRFFVEPYEFEAARIGTDIICPQCGNKHTEDDSLRCYDRRCRRNEDFVSQTELPSMSNYKQEEIEKKAEIFTPVSTGSGFQVGDVVQIKELEEMIAEYGGNGGEPNVTFGWSNEMNRLCGQVFTITGMETERFSGDIEIYGARSDGWTISKDMIKKVED